MAKCRKHSRYLLVQKPQGLSAATVSPLKKQCGDEYQAWCDSPLDKDDWVYRKVSVVQSKRPVISTFKNAVMVLASSVVIVPKGHELP